MQIGIRPLLMPSRLEDVAQKIMWGDEHWALLPAAGATVELVDGNVYLAMSLRNSGSGIGVIHGWHLGLRDPHTPHPHAEPDEFRPQLRDLYVPGGDIGFWRRRSGTRTIQSTPHSSRMFLVELLYTDEEGAQRAITTFLLAPGKQRWLCSAIRHRNLDRPDPR